MAAFQDLLDLRTAVIEQVGRSDIVDVFPRLVSMAEANLNRNLRTTDQIIATVLTMASGSVALPVNFLEVIGVYSPAGLEHVATTLQNAKGGSPSYAIKGGYIEAPKISGDITLQYYASIPTISTGMDASNWLLQKYPAAYLYAVAFEAAKWSRDRDLASDMGGLMRTEIDDIRAEDERNRYSRSRVRVQGVTP